MMQTSFVVARRASSVSPIMCASTTKKASFADRFKSNKTVQKGSKLFNDFHKQRSETIKGNVNHINVISQKDLNEVNAFLKDLDLFHREQFEEIKASFSKRGDSEKTETIDNTEDKDKDKENESDSKSIFLKKE